MVARKRAVIFDLDGTLIDAFMGIHDALSHTMSTLGFAPLSFPETKRLVGHGLEHLLAHAMSPDVVARAVPVYRARYAEIAVTSALPLPGAAEHLARLAAAGVRLAVASNKPSYFSRQIITGLGWDDWVSEIRGPDQVVEPKPHPAMIESLLDAFAAAPGDALYVGDMTVDLETGRRAGIDVVLVSTGSMSEVELRAAGAEHVYPSLSAALSTRV